MSFVDGAQAIPPAQADRVGWRVSRYSAGGAVAACVQARVEAFPGATDQASHSVAPWWRGRSATGRMAGQEDLDNLEELKKTTDQAAAVLIKDQLTTVAGSYWARQPSRQVLGKAAEWAAQVAAAQEYARLGRPGPVAGPEWGRYCQTMIGHLNRQLFPGVGQERGDDLIGPGTALRRSLGEPGRWAPVTDWPSLIEDLRTAGEGAVVFVEMGRPNQISHALALAYIGEKEGLFQVNPTTIGHYIFRRITPSELTGKLGILTEARALIRDVRGRPVTPRPTPEPTTQTLADPTLYPYVGGPAHPDGRYYEISGNAGSQRRATHDGEYATLAPSLTDYLYRLPSPLPNSKKHRAFAERNLPEVLAIDDQLYAESLTAVLEDVFNNSGVTIVDQHLQDGQISDLMTVSMSRDYPEIETYLQRVDTESREDINTTHHESWSRFRIDNTPASVIYDNTNTPYALNLLIGYVGYAVSIMQVIGYRLPPFYVYLPKYTRSLEVSLGINSETGAPQLDVSTEDELDGLAQTFYPNVIVLSSALAAPPQVNQSAMYGLFDFCEERSVAIIIHELIHLLHRHQNPLIMVDLWNTALIDQQLIALLRGRVSEYAASGMPEEIVAEIGLAFVLEKMDVCSSKELRQLYLALGGPTPEIPSRRFPDRPLDTNGMNFLTEQVNNILRRRGDRREVSPQIVAAAHARLSPYERRLVLSSRATLIDALLFPLRPPGELRMDDPLALRWPVGHVIALDHTEWGSIQERYRQSPDALRAMPGELELVQQSPERLFSPPTVLGEIGEVLEDEIPGIFDKEFLDDIHFDENAPPDFSDLNNLVGAGGEELELVTQAEQNEGEAAAWPALAPDRRRVSMALDGDCLFSAFLFTARADRIVLRPFAGQIDTGLDDPAERGRLIESVRNIVADALLDPAVRVRVPAGQLALAFRRHPDYFAARMEADSESDWVAAAQQIRPRGSWDTAIGDVILFLLAEAFGVRIQFVYPRAPRPVGPYGPATYRDPQTQRDLATPVITLCRPNASHWDATAPTVDWRTSRYSTGQCVNVAVVWTGGERTLDRFG